MEMKYICTALDITVSTHLDALCARSKKARKKIRLQEMQIVCCAEARAGSHLLPIDVILLTPSSRVGHRGLVSLPMS